MDERTMQNAIVDGDNNGDDSIYCDGQVESVNVSITFRSMLWSKIELMRIIMV